MERFSELAGGAEAGFTPPPRRSFETREADLRELYYAVSAAAFSSSLDTSYTASS
jgi:hypothetical protein